MLISRLRCLKGRLKHESSDCKNPIGRALQLSHELSIGRQNFPLTQD
jgi:hypothetical protein